MLSGSSSCISEHSLSLLFSARSTLKLERSCWLADVIFVINVDIDDELTDSRNF